MPRMPSAKVTGSPKRLEEMDADEAYPETDGYDDFVRKHSASMAELCAISDEASTLMFLKSHLQLMLGSGHFGRWLMLRHTEMLQSGAKAGAVLSSEAFQFFLLDCACDAANAFFVRKHGAAALANNQAELLTTATEGVNMLARALSLPGDPMRMRDKLNSNVSGSAKSRCWPISDPIACALW